jgi:hypothetical protein
MTLETTGSWEESEKNKRDKKGKERKGVMSKVLTKILIMRAANTNQQLFKHNLT